MATKAACDVIISSVDEEEIYGFIHLLNDLIGVAQDFAQNEDYDVLLCILGLFDDITSSSDSAVYEPYLIGILELCCAVWMRDVVDCSCYKAIPCCILFGVSQQMQLPVSFRIMHRLLPHMFFSVCFISNRISQIPLLELFWIVWRKELILYLFWIGF